jgi:hypothetical protein
VRTLCPTARRTGSLRGAGMDDDVKKNKSRKFCAFGSHVVDVFISLQ